MKPQVFQRDDRVYIVGPVSGFAPGNDEIEQFAFAEALKSSAPNGNIMWLRGHYVEADSPNRNGQMWTAGELSLKHLTPRLMPVTVMHDPSTAVGLIADTKLTTPDRDGVGRARIDTSLAVWKHRFPEVAEECEANWQQGTLMQSMECIPGYFECASCGFTLPNLPSLAFEQGVCEHLSPDSPEPGARILGNTVFTGTGLIFGTQGSRGAYNEAHLDVFQDEVAEFHQESRSSKTKTKRPRSQKLMETIEISRTEYAELQKRPSSDELAAAETARDEALTAKAQADKDLEAAEAAKVAAETAKEAAETKANEAEEVANAEKLSKERLAKLGTGFNAKLGDKTKERLNEQSKSMKDEDWDARLEELAELVGVKSDEGGEEESGSGEEFSAEEVASAQVGSEGKPSSGSEPSRERRSSVVAGLIS